MITFRKITRYNYDQIISLDPGEENLKYFPPNWMIMLSAHYTNHCLEMKAIYYNNLLIGFFLLTTQFKPLCLEYFMIDKKYQNKGIGNKCLKKIITYIKSNYIIDKIFLSTSSPIAFNLCEKNGFQKLKNKIADKYIKKYNKYLLVFNLK